MRSLRSNNGAKVSPVLVVGLLLAVVLPIAWFFWSGDRGGTSPRSTGPVDSVTAIPSATPAPSESSTTTSEPSASTQPASVECEQATELEPRVRCFVEAWYFLTPDDSTETKRARIEPYASELFMEQSAGSMEVYTDTNADQARIKSKVTTSGEVVGDILLEPYGEHGEELMRVFTTVTLSEQSLSSSSTPYLRLYAEMVWSNHGGTWRVESIQDLGGV